MLSAIFLPGQRRCLAVTMTAVAALLAFSRPTLAAPEGGNVVSGSATISQSGNITNVNQSTNKAVINWQRFSVGSQETVNFNQPNSSSMTLNRVIGNEKSIIDGALNANGKVFLINSAGVLIGNGARINTSGLVASTRDISNDDFNAGRYVFSGQSDGEVVNLGSITAQEGGYVVLLGKTVSNQGVIAATKGTISLNGANKVTLNFNGDSLVGVTLDEGALNALVENKRAIIADGGTVILTAKAADELLSAQVNNSGEIQARTIDDLKGNIQLYAHGGTANVAGTIDASAPNGGDGGFIETSGDKVKVADSTVVTTKSATGKDGTWLIDPDGYTVGIGGDMTGAALAAALDNTSVEIRSTQGRGTDGNITVNDAVSWSKNTLTLSATSNIYVNSIMGATGTAGLVANYGSGTNADGTPMGLYTAQGSVSGTTGTFLGRINFTGSGGVTMNGSGYTVINSSAQLDAARSNPAGNYVLGADFNFGSAWTDSNGGANLGGDTTGFSGDFNGFGHKISAAKFTNSGLFGVIGSSGKVSNLAVTATAYTPDANSTRTAVGLLANVNQGKIVNSFTASNSSVFAITSAGVPTVAVQDAGGLVGINSGLIAQSYSVATVNGVTVRGGGLVGSNSGTIIDSQVRGGGVTATAATVQSVGGLVGVNSGSILRSVFANAKVELTGAAANATRIGGLVGLNTGRIDQAAVYNGGSNLSFKGTYAAGFVGENANTGIITNSYTALSDTSGSDWIAGFAYKNSGSIATSYASGFIPTSSSQGHYGFVADNTGGSVVNSYWSFVPASGVAAPTDSSGARYLTPEQAAIFANYAGFDSTVWGAATSGHPILRNLPVYAVNTSSSLYYGSATSSAGSLNLVIWGLQGGGGDAAKLDSSSVFTAATDGDYVNAGTWTSSSLLINSPYTNIRGAITVKPKVLTGDVADKVYDGTSAGTVGSLSGLVFGQSLNILSSSATFANKNVGSDKSATVNWVVLGDSATGKASNYTVSTGTSSSADITQKAITASVNVGGSKSYDGTADASSVVTGGLSGVVAGESVSLGWTSALFTDKNAGTGKSVTVNGLTLSGADAANYRLETASATTTGTASITPVALDLYAIKVPVGSTTVNAADLLTTNGVTGDQLGLTGSVQIAGGGSGYQQITDFSGLRVGNANYTLSGATGGVMVGGGNLVQDPSAGMSGISSILTSGSTTTITQSAARAIINWLNFSIAAGETVIFQQPDSSAVVLNRVRGAPSVIAGTLTANGRVFIINSHGVLFANGSHVNTAALVASTLGISDANFNNGTYRFTAQPGGGSVSALGNLDILDGGFAVLASAGDVSQSGSLTADGGKAVLASARQVELVLDGAGNGLTSDTLGGVSGTTSLAGTVDLGNGGQLETAGKNVAVDSGFSLNTGTGGGWSWTQDSVTVGTGSLTSALVSNSLAQRDMTFNAQTGGITVNGAIDWSSDRTLALKAATDIAVNKSITATGTNAGLAMTYGGDYSILTPASYSGTTPGGNGDPIAKAAPAGTQYASITLSGANSSLRMNGNAYTLIRSAADLSSLPATLTGYYALAQNLTVSGTTYSAAPINTLAGTLAGLGHTVDGLTISADNSATQNFGFIDNSTASSLIRDIGITNLSIRLTGTGSTKQVGGLIGTSYGDIKNAYATGQIYVTAGLSSAKVGGLVGYQQQTTGVTKTIANSFAAVNVAASGFVGGLVGRAQQANFVNTHATGRVWNTGNGGTGGLVGYLADGSIYNSYATGAVANTVDLDTGALDMTRISNGIYVGGLVGQIYSWGTAPSYVLNSFASGNVSGGTLLGGLIGSVFISGQFTLDHSYATGNVTAYQNGNWSSYVGIGGLIGSLSGSAATLPVTISYARASGNVAFTGEYGDYAGGLIGSIPSTYSSSTKLTIDSSSASGNVTGSTKGTGAGGLVGQSGSNTVISNSNAYGNVSGNVSTGGLVGTNLGLITNSKAYGNVRGSGNQVGGLVGANTGAIYKSQAYGSVTGVGPTTAAGTLVGTNNGTGIVMDSQGFGGGNQIGNNLGRQPITTDLPNNNGGGQDPGQGREDTALRQASTLVSGVARQGGASPSAEQVARTNPPPLMENNIVFTGESYFGADINGIEVDGVRYDLGTRNSSSGNEEEDKKRN